MPFYLFAPEIRRVATTNSMAIETWSFMSGMSKQDVVSRAQSRGNLVDQSAGVTVVHRRDAATGAMETYLLSCLPKCNP
ncbi:hypothetical protein BDI4_580046 [Burkholderia diffusa]|nr:hypothetical protein BDI4_580046 [Burkholderia diffusa]